MAKIEIDGQEFTVENGKMIIEVADEAGIYIPRFCYHKKLSVAANCRMCLVEVENNKKTVPACATPITDGMKVFTKSKAAIHSQEAVMSFLLINHPLDCPICDQGGECELQDISMGYGEDETTYHETKRAVANDDLGPLISTEMTRCIHCTRCVRFGDEVAGVRELGALGRGENMQIGTAVQHSMTSNVSGNIIDLCPVGALTSKPFRFTARAWELTQHNGVAIHDCLGSNIYVHTRRNEWMRVVPKENETLNETWVSDRDRFSYLGMKSKARAAHPMVKRNGQWKVVDWEEALTFAAEGIKRILTQHGASEMAAFASASSTLEELYLLQKMMRSLGVSHLDHRVQQTDFRDDAQLPMMPTSSLPYREIERQETILIVGCHLSEEVPLAAVRVRKAFRNGAKIYAINPVDYDSPFDLTEKIIVSPDELPTQLASLVLSLVKDVNQLPQEVQKLVIGLKPTAAQKSMAKALMAGLAVIITGALLDNHPDAALLRSLVALIASLSACRQISLTTGANSRGAWFAGMIPHRGVAGREVEHPGLDVQAALGAKLKGYVLMALEPGFDFANPYRARQSMLAAEFVVMLTAFQNESMQEYADVILPIAPFSETSGTYINVDSTWQTTKGALAPFGESRPAWKICRVLANLLQLKGFDYVSSDEVLKELKQALDMASERSRVLFYPEALPSSRKTLVRVGEWPMVRSDMIVRHAEALQNAAFAEPPCIRIHPKTAEALQLGETATVSQGDIEITLPLYCDERVAKDVVWVANAMPETADLGYAFDEISIKP